VKRQLVLFIAAFGFILFEGTQSHGKILDGTVIGIENERIVCAKVSLRAGEFEKTILSDASGNFICKLPDKALDSLSVVISSIGYESRSFILPFVSDTLAAVFVLNEKPIDFGAVTVTSAPTQRKIASSLTNRQIDAMARHSLMASNPISAVRGPQMIREGSSHSAKIRMSGTNPVYYINGIEMGQDPNHYGMFTIVPGSVVDQLAVYSWGTNAAYGTPSSIELSTQKPFGKGTMKEIDLSFIEGTGTFYFGSDKIFILSSVRKSVLDRLADRISNSADKSTIPPTNFRDFFVSSGIKASKNTLLFTDHYFVGDYLVYNLDSTPQNPDGISPYQHTGEQYNGIRIENISPHLIFKAGGAVRSRFETYVAQTPKEDAGAFAVDLRSMETTMLGNASADINYGATILSLGGNIEYTPRKRIHMIQSNWNFLPPDALSDYPYVYQDELNTLFGSMDKVETQSERAAFVSICRSIGPLKIENGLRFEQFPDLGDKSALLYRNSVRLDFGAPGLLELFHGTYATHPVGPISDSYQALIFDNLFGLYPIETEIAAAAYVAGPIKLCGFRKTISHLPRLVPDFSRIDEAGVAEEGFLSMQSTGRLHAVGGDITFDFENLANRLDIYAYYAYTRAQKIASGIAIPYELNAPHKFFGELNCRIGSRVSAGGNFSFRTGFRYTEPSADPAVWSERYTEDYYLAALENENQRQFPDNIVSNLFLNLNLGRADIYCALTNISDRRNPIISTAGGFIYDTGLLPSVGMKYRF